MIKDRKILNMYEADEILDGLKETDKSRELRAFIKKFSNTDAKTAKKIKEGLESLNLIKLKNSDIVKIIEILPENAIELNKIITEASLDENEINKILDTIKSNK
jgi:DNA-directed RNA polymerase subunit F